MYSFNDVSIGEYALYLVESDGNEIFCCNVTVEAATLTTLPEITYIPYSDEDDEDYDDDDFDDGEVIIDDDFDEDTVKTRKYGAIKGYCYDATGKLLSGIDIYCNSKSHHTKTDSKGVFEFDQVPPGKYKLCTVLDDGSVYVFKTVKVEAGKGIIAKVMMPAENSGLPLFVIILIIAGGVLLLAGGTLLTVFLIKKKSH